jgi:hypothetical protein
MRYLILGFLLVLALIAVAIMSVDTAAAHGRTICRGGNDGDWFSLVTGARSCVRTRARRHRPDYHYDHGRHGYIHHRGPRVHGYYRYDDEGYGRRERECHALVTVKGAEAMTQDGALKLVKRAWRATVRADHGEVYIDLNNAKDRFGDKGAEYRCWRSSTNETSIGKLGEYLPGAYRKRCQVWARPCMGARFKDKEDRDDND